MEGLMEELRKGIQHLEEDRLVKEAQRLEEARLVKEAAEEKRSADEPEATLPGERQSGAHQVFSFRKHPCNAGPSEFFVQTLLLEKRR